MSRGDSGDLLPERRASPVATVLSWGYTIMMYALLPVVLLRTLGRGLRQRTTGHGLCERLGYARALRDTPIWIHAVSVGEAGAALALIRELLKHETTNVLVATTTTPTGHATLTRHPHEPLAIYYCPLDLPGPLKRFLNRIRPKLLVLMETELWPNMIAECSRRRIPIILVNARLSERSARRYRLIAPLTTLMLHKLRWIAAQSASDARRFQSLAIAPIPIHTTGNLKFDIPPPSDIDRETRSWRGRLGARRAIWIAASTHDGEETIVLDAFDILRRQFADCLLILAPRHIRRVPAILELCRHRNLSVQRRSAHESVDADTRVFVLDTMGELLYFYAASDVAFVGGSLVGSGGHNLLEPACVNVPILIGPYTYNFAEITQGLLAEGAASVVHTPGELAAAVAKLLRDDELRTRAGAAGRAYYQSHQGTAYEISTLIRELVMNADPESDHSHSRSRSSI